ncbi:MAG TPA: outer membrane beta-barrel protein [Rhodanobacteraceae bacterium]
MRNTAIALAVAAVFVAAPGFVQQAHAQDATNTTGTDSGFFVNGNAGHSYFGSGQNSGSDTGYAIGGGYRWGVAPGFAIGPEVGYNDLGNVRVHNVFNSQPVISDNKSSLHGWTVGANAKYNFNPNWYVSARTGLYHWNGHGMTRDITPISTARNGDGYYGGVGVGYDFSRNFGIGVNYDYYRAKKDNINLSTGLLSAQAEVRF